MVAIHPATAATFRQASLLAARRGNVKISEREVLQVLSVLALYGAAIEPDFMKLAGATLAKALAANKLPNKTWGRPPSTGQHDPMDVARKYYDRLDAGESHEAIVPSLANSLSADERTIERLCAEGEPFVGATKNEREEFRRGAELRRAALEGEWINDEVKKLFADETKKLDKAPLEVVHGLTDQQLADIIGPSTGTRKSPSKRKPPNKRLAR